MQPRGGMCVQSNGKIRCEFAESFVLYIVSEKHRPRELGRGLGDALALTNQEVVDALGGLPAHKLHCSVLAEEAVKSAIQDYYEKNHIEYDHSKFPKKEDCESCCRMV